MSGRNERGSALVITMLLLVVLTALALYMVGLSASGIEMASEGEADKAAMNAAEAGAYYGIDRLPLLASEVAVALPNGATYDVSAAPSGTETMPGFDTDWTRAVFRVRSTGRAPSGAGPARTVEAGAEVGPVPSGTGY